MCMLTYYPENVQPNSRALRNGTIYNDDGHGFAIVVGDRFVIRHHMDAERAISEFMKYRRRFPAGPALFHSRMGTAGKQDRRNCHPFRVGGDRKTLVAHNGVLPNLVQPENGDKRCDTRVFAEDLLPGYDLSDYGTRRNIEEWMGSGNKLVFLTINPRYPEQSYILNEASGVWDATDGCWYSNDDYCDPHRYYRYYQLGKKYTTEHSDGCMFCDCPDSVDQYNYCLNCGICQDCQMDAQDCDCYMPEYYRGMGAPAVLESREA